METTTKHTKGEWTVKDDFREPKILNQSGQIIFTHNKQCYDSDGNADTYYSHNKMMSNAKLIAAAPDMLEALMTAKSILDKFLFPSERESDPTYQKVIKAIIKATK